MQKAPILKGSGLKPLEETESSEEVHVFGKNLEERVITPKEDEKSSQVSFVTSRSDQSQSENDIESIKKRKFDAITGEEDEKTEFQGDFKLFVWDIGSSNWMEKGRGQLKLNDRIEDQTTKSRLIMRISGTLRIILNVAINQSTFKIISGSKTNIRFTDSLTVWAVSGSNAQQLKKLLEERLINSNDDTNNATSCAVTTDEEPPKRPKADPVPGEEKGTSAIADRPESAVVEATKDNESPLKSSEVEPEEPENVAREENKSVENESDTGSKEREESVEQKSDTNSPSHIESVANLQEENQLKVNPNEKNQPEDKVHEDR